MFKKTTLSVLLMAVMHCAYAQQTNLDSLSGKINQLSSEVNNLKKVKFSGFIQAQWQKADTEGIRSFAGGNFEPNTDNRFSVRQGRLKMTYASNPVTAVLQINVTEKGILIRDAYGEFKFPGAAENLSFKAGIFMRPFGFELTNSSGSRESPERARVVQTIFPGERDLGAMLAYKLGPVKIEGGLFNGNASSVDYDSKKDFIGRIYTTKEFEKVKIGGGVNYYYGGVRQGTKRVYGPGGGKFVLKDTLTALGKHAKRQYTGVNLQISVASGIGTTTLRSEFITGKQPGTATSSESPKSSALPNQDTYIRSFNAGIFYFLQNIGKTGLQVVAKYDFYDPNSNASGGNLATEGDLKYSTLGFGLNYYWKNLTFMAYYDLVKNESSSTLSKYKNDLDDNVFTLRTQFKF